MYYAMISFKQMPKIGFAHHFRANGYKLTRQVLENSLEIAYIKEGTLTIEYGGETMTAEPGSIFVLLRPFPLTITSDRDCVHTHCTVQLLSDFDIRITAEKDSIPKDYKGLVLPFVTSPGKDGEYIKKKLYSIVSDISVSREANEFSSSLCAMGILHTISDSFKKEITCDFRTSSIICYKIKSYISAHINEVITLADLARNLGKTSIYLNSVFKSETGTTIHRYINGEKIRLVAELMSTKGLSFRKSCESVGIDDISYGYRLFKKYMSITPGEYKNSNKLSR
jgi:AraC-like DNA-binding protein